MDERERLRNLATMEDDRLKKAQKEWLEEVIETRNETLTELARAAKVNPSTLTRFFNNPDHKSNLSATTVSKIESLTGMKSPVPNKVTPMWHKNGFVNVVGVAKAGAFFDVSVADDEIDEVIPVGPNPRYSGKTQYALRIEGTSINRHPKAQDGDYAICVVWGDLGLSDPPNEKFVHVQRQRGGLTEVTIKKVEYTDGEPHLVPFSNDPRHTERLTLSHPDEDTIVEIKGLVIGWYSHED